MSKTGITRITLFVILVLLTGIEYSAEHTMLFSSSFAQAQDDSTSQKPPLRRPKTHSSNNEEEETPKGRTSISVDVDLVTLQALVTDNKGNILTGLKPENFTIYENNVKQEILHFSPVDANITVVMVVEFNSTLIGKKDIRDNLLDTMYYFAKSLRKGDWVAVVGYDMHTTIMCDFTQDHQKLENALSRFVWPSWRESNLSDAIIETLDRTQELDGKIAVLLISSGLDTLSKHTYDQALEACKKANASIYSVGIGQLYRDINAMRISPEENMDWLMGDNRLKSFSEFSGGASFFPHFSAELPEIFDNISNSLRNQYSMSYSSSNTAKDGKFRKIRVEAQTDLLDAKGKPLKLKIITRKGYMAKAL
jgi:VWFA-related protein